MRVPTLYIRNVPPEVYEALKARAQREGRSVNAEALALLGEVAERERGRAAVEHFLALADEIGRALPPDTRPAEEVIRQMREERDHELMRRTHGDD